MVPSSRQSVASEYFLPAERSLAPSDEGVWEVEFAGGSGVHRQILCKQHANDGTEQISAAALAVHVTSDDGH